MSKACARSCAQAAAATSRPALSSGPPRALRFGQRHAAPLRLQREELCAVSLQARKRLSAAGEQLAASAPWACRGREARCLWRCWRTTSTACATWRGPLGKRFWLPQDSAPSPRLERRCLLLRWRYTPACASWPTCTPARSCLRAACWCDTAALRRACRVFQPRSRARAAHPRAGSLQAAVQLAQVQPQPRGASLRQALHCRRIRPHLWRL